MTLLPLRPPVFSILSALIEERSGLHYDPADIDIVESKLSSRVVDAGFESFLDYYYYLRYDDPEGAELAALLDALVVNETYLFRELDGLERLVEEIVAPAVARGARPRVWCAACSTGEEPFTLAMLLAGRGILGEVELVASDISHRALARARSGELRERSLRRPPGGLEARWLVEREGRAEVRPELRRAIRFQRVNLIDARAVAGLGTFDAVVCRNVLIYFGDATAMRVVGNLSAALRPGGLLLVGVSESLLRFGTSLACEERGGVFFYRKEP